MTGAGLADPYRVRLGDQTTQVIRGAQATGGRIFYRDGVTSQITPVGRHAVRAGHLAAGRDGHPAGRDGRLPGVVLGLRRGARAPAYRVVGIYRNQDQEAVRPYWCSYTNLFQNPSYGNDSTPPPLVIASDAATFQAGPGQLLRLQHGQLGLPGQDHRHHADRGPGDRRQAGRGVRGAGLTPSQRLADLNSGTGRMPEFVERTELTRDGLRGPVLPIALGGSILALLLVGAAGSYWADRRSREVRLLSSRGVGPGALALKAVLELALPAVVGTVPGWLLARWLVALLGPSPLLDRAAPWQAGIDRAGRAGRRARAAGAGGRAAVSRAATERPVGSRRGWVAVVPWELLLLAAAGGCWLRLRGSDAVTLDAGIAQINLLVVAFPLLFLAGAAVLIVRLLGAAAAPAGPVGRPAAARPGIWPPAGSPPPG